MKKAPEKLGSEYYRSFLTRQAKAFYDKMLTQFLRGDYSGETVFSLSNEETATADCFAAYKAIRDDHPEFFYLGFQSEFTRCGKVGTLKYPILYQPETIVRIQQQLRKSIYRIVRGTAGLDTVEREKLVYERIARKLSYANHSDVRDHNVVGPVLLSSGVCEGHNALLLLCFRRIGIPCIKVYGKTKTDGWHCWTIAWVNGISVHCDVTWDGADEGVMRFDYFNLSDNQISKDHYDFKNDNIPKCTSERFRFYTYYGLCVNSFNDVRSHLKNDTDTGVSPILLHFSYSPPFGDYLKEVQRALSIEKISGSHQLYYNPVSKNLAVKKM